MSNLTNTTDLPNLSIPLDDISLYTFAILFSSWVLILGTMGIMLLVQMCRRDDRCVRTKCIVLPMIIFVITGIVAPMTIMAVAYGPINQAYNDVSAYNDVILANRKICNVTSIDILNNLPDGVTGYVAHFALINSTNPADVGQYSGFCQAQGACYPIVGQIINCYKVAVGYSNIAPTLDKRYFEKHRTMDITSMAFGAVGAIIIGIWIFALFDYWYN